MSWRSQSPAKQVIWPTLLIVAVLSLDAFAQPPRNTRAASADRLDMLRRFVEECVSVTPGDGQFPDLQIRGAPAAPFRIARYETTQELYQAITGTNPSRWKGPRNSVETVNWLDATAFCRQLTIALRTEKLISEDDVVRLPDSAEWEYCCRAGSETLYSFGDDVIADDGTSLLDEFAWHTGNAAGNDPAVGVLKPNSWGLYDVHGYLWELTSDRWSLTAGTNEQSVGGSTSATEVRRTDSPGEPLRTMHGGSWRDEYRLLKSSSKLPVPEYASSDAIGFRCVIAKKALEKDATRR